MMTFLAAKLGPFWSLPGRWQDGRDQEQPLHPDTVWEQRIQSTETGQKTHGELFHLFYYYLMLETVLESMLTSTIREVPAFLNRQKLLRSP